ncbi:MAG: hypothetical protein HY328_10815 [Chloroflexi bacterium]|nr:hypothetical protein [Chloroflexota bacterium]
MSTLLVALPLPPGGAEKFEGFVAEVNARLEDHARSRTQLGVTQEVCAIQDMPDGGKLFILCLGGDDPVEGNRLFAASQQAYDRWFKDNVGPIFNINFDEPIPPISRTVFDWRA